MVLDKIGILDIDFFFDEVKSMSNFSQKLQMNYGCYFAKRWKKIAICGKSN